MPFCIILFRLFRFSHPLPTQLMLLSINIVSLLVPWIVNSSPVTVNIVQIKWTNIMKKILYICAGNRAEYMAAASIGVNR